MCCWFACNHDDFLDHVKVVLGVTSCLDAPCNAGVCFDARLCLREMHAGMQANVSKSVCHFVVNQIYPLRTSDSWDINHDLARGPLNHNLIAACSQ